MSDYLSNTDPKIMNYTAVAIVGLLAGLLLGLAFGSVHSGDWDSAKPPVPPHPRSLEPHSG